jgi:WD40 repeat protein
MKKHLFICLFVCQSLYSNAQIKLFGFERQMQVISYNADESRVIGYGSNWTQHKGQRTMGRNIIIWDAKTGEIIKNIDCTPLRDLTYNGTEYLNGMLRECSISPDKKRICITAKTYYAKDGKDLYQMVLHFYDIEKDSLYSVMVDKTHQPTKAVFHPTNADLMAFIAIDKDTEMVSAVYSISQNKILHYLMKGKGLIMPLSIDFSAETGQAYIGYGTGKNNEGGFEVYDTESGKLLKKIPLRDEPMYFSEWNNQLIVGCSYQTFFFNLKTFALIKTEKIIVSNIHQSKNIALLNPIELADTKQVQIYDLKTGKKINLSQEGMSNPCFNTQGNQLIGIKPKNEFDESSASLSVPSAYIYTLEDK